MQLEEKNNRIEKIIETAIKNIDGLIDTHTIIGKPLKTEDGDYILPVSKVSVGILAGGGEYGKISIFKNSDDLPYSAGNGTIISVKPCCFLVKENNNYKILSVAEKPYEKVFEKITDLISNIQNDNYDKTK